MPQTPHIERHFTSSDVVRDIVIGMSDGLTVPFALAAGLTGAIEQTGIIVTAGLAEIAAGSIAMGLGGYLAAKSDAEHYAKEREREKREVIEIPDEEMREVAQVFKSYGLSDRESAPIVGALASALTIGGSYAVGGLVPLLPYIAAALFKNITVATALLLSVTFTLLALLVFGFVKGRYTGTRPTRSALQTALIGSVAAGAAFLIARLIS